VQVVLVEDEAVCRNIVETTLRENGHNVTSFTTGDDAVAVLDEGLETDLLITDINLPGEMDGWAVAHLYRDEFPKLPVIYITSARQLTDHVTRSVYLRKPVSLRLLLEAVSAFS
jgi:CheY-like chemotaxis protein